MGLVVTTIGVAVGIGVLVVYLFQLRAMNSNIVASTLGAEAAMLNAQPVIYAERPWVTIFTVQEQAPDGYSFRACNLGRTPVEIISFAAEFRCVENIQDLPAIPEYGTEQVPVIRLLVPGGQIGQADLELMPAGKVAYSIGRCRGTEDKVVYAMTPGRRLPVFCFRVISANALSKVRLDMPNHATRMCFSFPFLRGEKHGVCGTEAYNRIHSEENKLGRYQWSVSVGFTHG